jgi:hypothetical protein
MYHNEDSDVMESRLRLDEAPVGCVKLQEGLNRDQIENFSTGNAFHRPKTEPTRYYRRSAYDEGRIVARLGSKTRISTTCQICRWKARISW